MVVNAPHVERAVGGRDAVALLLSLARNIPQAHAALVAGKWERSRWEGVELHGRCSAWSASAGWARWWRSGCRRSACAWPRSTLRLRRPGPPDGCRPDGTGRAHPDRPTSSPSTSPYARHRRADRRGAAGQGQAQPAHRQDRPRRHPRRGRPERRPPHRAGGGRRPRRLLHRTDHRVPLFELDSVVVTPHLGASTREAQDKAGETIAGQVLLALAGEFVPYAINVAATEASEAVRPFLPLLSAWDARVP